MATNDKSFGMNTGEQVSKNHRCLGSLLSTTIPPKTNRNPHALNSKGARLRVILTKKSIFLKGVNMKELLGYYFKGTKGKKGQIHARGIF